MGTMAILNIPLYKTKLPDDIVEYLWSVVERAEKDNVNNSNDYSHKTLVISQVVLDSKINMTSS